MQSLLIISEFFLVNGTAFHHCGAGFRAVGIFADEFGPFIDCLEVAGIDAGLVTFSILDGFGIGFVDRPENI